MIPIKVGQRYSQLETSISIEDSKPVLNQEQFSKLELSLIKLL
jgi:hypothetical protein